jgi:hypothetical protein
MAFKSLFLRFSFLLLLCLMGCNSNEGGVDGFAGLDTAEPTSVDTR